MQYDPAAMAKWEMAVIVLAALAVMPTLGALHFALNWLIERASWLLSHRKGESVHAYRVRRGWTL